MVRSRIIQPVCGLRRIIAHVHIELRNGIAGADPAFVGHIGVVRVFGIGRTNDGLRLFVGFLAVDQPAAVAVAEFVHVFTLAFEGVADRIADLHRDNERTVGAQRIFARRTLPFIASRTLDAVADDGRGHVKLYLGADAELQLGRGETALGIVFILVEILLVEFQRVAHGQPRALHQSRIFGAAIAVKRHIMGILGKSARQLGVGCTACEDNIAGQIAPREVERHPDRLLVERIFIRLPGIEYVDIITAVGLVVLHQIGTVLGHPRFERLILELNVRFVFVFRTGCQRQKAGNRHA